MTPWPKGKPRFDLTGKRFKRLVVIELAPRRKGVKRALARWRCKCDCGRDHTASGRDLRCGEVKSCGCLRREPNQRALTHGDSAGVRSGGKLTTEYRAWQRMKQRCLNPDHAAYADYGARGITVCRRWLNSFENFLADMGRKPSPELTLERKNNSLGYRPSNCTWAPWSAQNNNRRRPRGPRKG
jgi:hypothetical protein